MLKIKSCNSFSLTWQGPDLERHRRRGQGAQCSALVRHRVGWATQQVSFPLPQEEPHQHRNQVV